VAFFPRVLSVFSEIKSGRTPPPKLDPEGFFDGSLVGAIGQKASDGVLLVPPGNLKPNGLARRLNGELARAAKGVQTRRGGFVGVLDEVHATERDLKGTVVWLFATPSSPLASR